MTLSVCDVTPPIAPYGLAAQTLPAGAVLGSLDALVAEELNGLLEDVVPADRADRPAAFMFNSSI